MKNLVFPRIFLHCVALGFIVSGLLLSGRSEVRILLSVPRKSLDFQGFFVYLPPFLAGFAKKNCASAKRFLSVFKRFFEGVSSTSRLCLAKKS